MENKSVIFLVSSVILAIILLGIFGIPEKITFVAGNCNSEYTRYIIEPYLKNIFIEKFQNNEDYARLGILKCLCQNTDENFLMIREYYDEQFNNPLKIEISKSINDKNNATQICDVINFY